MDAQNDTGLLEDSLALPEMPSFQSKFVSSEDEYMESDDLPPNRIRLRFQPHGPVDSRVIMPSAGVIKQEIRPRPAPHTWLHKLVHLITCYFSSYYFSLTWLIDIYRSS